MNITTSLKRVLLIGIISSRFVLKEANFAHWLSQRGHDVTVVSIEPPTRSQDKLVRYIPLPIGNRSKLFRYVQHLLLLIPLAQRTDWIIGINDPGIILSSVLSFLGNVKFFMAMAQEHYHLEKSDIAHTLVTNAYRSANVVTEVSDEGVTYRQERMGLQKIQLVRFMNVPLYDFFSPYVRQKKPDSEPLSLIYIGGIAEGVALNYLIEAMKIVEKQATLQIYGYGDTTYISYLNNLIEKNQLQKTVMIYGPVDPHLSPKLLAGADIGIALTLYLPGSVYGSPRACPNKMFEYIAAGLPVLVSQNISNLSWLRQYPVGVYVDPENPQSIASGIRKFLEPGVLEQMSRAAIQAHREEWNLEHEADRVYAAADAAWQLQIRKNEKKF